MASPSRSVRLNTDTNFLKLIAIASMLVDHIGAAFFPKINILRIIGRIAFPIFCYTLSVGAIYTRSVPKYALRLLIMGLISQPFYALALNHTPYPIDQVRTLVQGLDWYVRSFRYSNIMFELLLGLMVLWSLRERKYLFTALMVLVVQMADPYLSSSYGFEGIMLIVLFYAFIDKPLPGLVWIAGFMLWWGASFTLPGLGRMPGLSIRSNQFWTVLSLPLIFIPMKTGIKLNRWVFYLFYPAHLLGIWLTALLLR